MPRVDSLECLIRARICARNARLAREAEAAAIAEINYWTPIKERFDWRSRFNDINRSRRSYRTARYIMNARDRAFSARKNAENNESMAYSWLEEAAYQAAREAAGAAA